MTGRLHPHRPYGGGRAEGLLRLFWPWLHGVQILAGTGVPPADPVYPHTRVSLPCDNCPTWTFGDSTIEAADRLAQHHRRCHG